MPPRRAASSSAGGDPPAKRRTTTKTAAKAAAATKAAPVTREPIADLNANVMLEMENNIQAILQHPLFDGIMTAPALEFGSSIGETASAVQDSVCLLAGIRTLAPHCFRVVCCVPPQLTSHGSDPRYLDLSTRRPCLRHPGRDRLEIQGEHISRMHETISRDKLRDRSASVQAEPVAKVLHQPVVERLRSPLPSPLRRRIALTTASVPSR